jgi:ribonuclease VapC
MILDSSAVLAVLFGEPGAGRVVGALRGGVVPAIIYAEILSKLSDAKQDCDDLGTVVLPMSQAQAETAARLTTLGKLSGLSLADRTCIGIALDLDQEVMTADRKWATAPHGAKVTLIR